MVFEKWSVIAVICLALYFFVDKSLRLGDYMQYELVIYRGYRDYVLYLSNK
jgi:hypothetical protein